MSSAVPAESHPFALLSPAEFDEVLRTVSHRRRVAPGEVVVQEGDAASSVFIIASGQAEVVKREPADGDEGGARLALLGAGTLVGEMALLAPTPRTATVRAVTEMELLELPIAEIQAKFPPGDAVGTRLLLSVAHELVGRLKGTNTEVLNGMRRELAEARARAAGSDFFSKLTAAIAGYMFLLGSTSSLVHLLPSPTYVGVPMLLLFAGVLVWIMKGSPYPLSHYGFNLLRWRRQLVEGLLLSVVMGALIVAVKLVLMRVMPEARGARLFELTRDSRLSLAQKCLVVGLYSSFAPLQEMIARGGIQSSLQIVLTGRQSREVAIVLATLIFSATHLHISVGLALAVFPLGLFWGWLYARHGSLLGVSVSHVLVGDFALAVVGFGFLFH